MKAVLVCHQEPRPVGHGGHRRAYQLRCDLEEALGTENVLIADNVWRYYRPRSTRQKLADFVENPLKLRVQTHFSRGLFAFPGFLEHYESLVAGLPAPALSIIEHAGFASLLPINARHGLRTVVCPQNVESFDTALDARGTWGAYARAIDFANELRVLARCDARLLISKVEAGLLGGLGLPGRYYPYRAVGAVRERLLAIRQARTSGSIEPGLFLMLGTAAHESTRESMAWFVTQALQQGLPAGARVIVAGLETERLLPEGAQVRGLELMGWIEDAELDQLMSRAVAVCLPQRSGFGALTRVAELACAGLPLLLSRHASLAIDVPPGTRIVNDDWRAWQEAMGAGARSADFEAYAAWEATQSREFVNLTREYGSRCG